MPDIETKTKTTTHWEKYGVLHPGQRLVITLAGQTIYDRTVPAGKQVRGYICVSGDVEAAT